MIDELRIRNLAVVEDTVLKFSPGLNVLTGETGAGKSIIISAVSLLSGKRADKSLIRRGKDSLCIEGVFRISEEWPFREYLGMEKGENRLSIKRKISSDSGSRIWINGTSSTNRTARKITGSLFELHGQHKQQELLDPETHIDYLDGRGDYRELLAECTRKVREYRAVRKKLRELRRERKEAEERRDFMEFQFRELERLNLEPGLKDELEGKISRSRNIHRYLSTLARIRDILDNQEGGAVDELSEAVKCFGELAAIDSKWEEHRDRMEGIVTDLSDILSSVDLSLQDDSAEEDNLEELQDRIAGIQRAERKYGRDYEELIEHRESLRRVLSELDHGSDRITEMKWKLEQSASELSPVLERLSEERKKNAGRLDNELSAELRKLGIEGALFKTEIKKIEIKSLSGEDDDIILPLKGWDVVEFTLRTNIGEDIRPLREIVSGGELSRVTLVLRSLLAAGKGIPTLIFDEIDTGLGADMGDRVSDKMIELSGSYQVICITHIPQIAAGAGKHIVIRKNIENNRTRSFASELQGEERVDELARMLGDKRVLSRKLAIQLVKDKSARSSVG
ncbi:MAG: DNA repair protein RecN [Candidatus Krumholzibacteriota bacterium]